MSHQSLSSIRDLMGFVEDSHGMTWESHGDDLRRSQVLVVSGFVSLCSCPRTNGGALTPRRPIGVPL